MIPDLISIDSIIASRGVPNPTDFFAFLNQN